MSRRIKVYIGDDIPMFVFDEYDVEMVRPSCFTQAERKLREMGVKGWVLLALEENGGVVQGVRRWIGGER